MNHRSTDTEIIGEPDPRVTNFPLFNRVVTTLVGWPWWALVIVVGLVAMFYSIFTSSLYSRAFHVATDNFTLSTNRIAQVSYLVHNSDGKDSNVLGTLIAENNDSVTLITQDEQRLVVPRSDLATISCDSSQNGENCPINSTVKVVRGSIDGTLIGQPSPGQYTIVTSYDQRETIAKIGVVPDGEVRTPAKCAPDPEGTCSIKLTLKPDYIGNQAQGVLLDNSAGLLTVQTTPPITQTIKKSDIVQENYRNPGSCALNNLGSCEGIFTTISVTLTSFALAVILGLIFGLMRISSNPIFTNMATLYVEIIRGIPILVLLLLVHFAFPPWLKENFPPAAPYLMLAAGVIAAITAIYYLVTRWRHRKTEPVQFFQPILLAGGVGIVVVVLLQYALVHTPTGSQVTRTPAFQSAVVGLAICYGAYLAELFRAGIQSIGRGQMEAARSLGMNYIQAMRYVILPQAFRVVLPPLGNEFIAMLKDSSLIAILTVAEMTYKAQIFAASVFRTFEPYLTIAVLYLCMTLFLSLMVRVVERRVQLPR